MVPILAGCAGSPPARAPVEDRVEDAAATRATAASPATHAEPARRETSSEVRVQPLAERRPARRGPLPPPRSVEDSGDAGPTARVNPAVVALVNRANSDSAAGRHDTAAASLERALGIEPGNAWLWHRLASARLAQGRGGEAVSLAQRSTALAAGDPALQARNWRLIARVHRQRGEAAAAREAERRARELDAPPS
jgi:predicted Zn-dependent protease